MRLYGSANPAVAQRVHQRGKGEEQNGRTLIVRNKNKDVEDFAYTLRVANGANWLDLDPGGKNQNGGIPLAHRAIGPLTGLVVGLGAASLASYALEPSGVLLLGVGGLVVGFLVALVLDQL